MEDEIAEPPKGWAWASYEQIGKWSGGGTPSKRIGSYWTGGAIPWISPKDMKTLRIYDSEDKITDVAIKNSPAKLIPSGSLLFVVRSGILRRTFPVALIKIDAAVNQDLKALTTSEYIFDEYLLYHALAFNEEIRRSCAKDGTTVESIEFSALKKYRIPLAPLPEQCRIVARIEELFSRLDAGVEALQRAKIQLRRYRQAVLKAAVEGRLTEEWRKAHPEVEPAEKLLERIDSTKWKKEKLAPEICNLPDVPDEWVWVNLGKIGNVSGGLTQNSKRNDFPLKMPYLRVANVYAAELRLEEMKDIGLGENELERVLLNQGDLLVVEGNGSPDQIGRVALWDGSISPCVHQNHIIKARFNPTCIGKYVLYWLLSTSGREQINTVASSTSGLYTLSISKVASLLVPFPSLLEQEKIVEEIESRLSIAKEQDKIIDLNILKADRLRQSILKRAFEGRLVPQNPSDEPATMLLERIGAERDKLESDHRRRSRLRDKPVQRQTDLNKVEHVLPYRN